MADIKVFERWDMDGVVVTDVGLKDYICLVPTIVPRTGGRAAKFRFRKSEVFIIERFMNRLMIPGHKSKKHCKSSGNITGKAMTAYKIMEETLAKIEEKTNENPIAVIVKAIENAAPREEIITIEYGGARYPKAVECAPQRRVDQTLKYMTQGAFQKSFNSRKSIVDCLATEILNAYNLSNQSFAISKKLETERQADSSR